MSRHHSTTVSPDTARARERGGRKVAVRRELIGRLIREEASRKAPSYAATAVAAVFFGLIVVPGFSSAVIPLSEGARSGGFFVDIYFLAIISTLSINAVSLSYMLIHRDPFSGWLVFLRSLPVSPREVILARSLVMIPATVVMTALFFAPLVGLSWALDYRFDAARYLWFGLVWLGYALASGGINLYLELGVRGKVVLGLQFAWLLLLAAVSWSAGGRLVSTTFELAGGYGPLPAGLALLAGGTLFAVFASATERRLGSRDLSA
jgi:hypothetical protein